MVDIKYDFLPPGAVVEEENEYFFFRNRSGEKKMWSSSNTVIIDTGNKLKAGIIDHHQPGSENACVASILVANPQKYLGHLIGQKDITIVTHFSPDFDAISSCYFVIKFLREVIFSEQDVLLSHYVNEVDSGKLTIDPSYPFTVASVINTINASFERENEKIVLEGLRFLEEVDLILKNDSNLWGDNFLRDLKGFDTYKKLIEEDIIKYQYDFHQRSFISTTYLLNINSGVLEEVDLIICKNPQSILWKYWVRGDVKNSPLGNGFIYTCALRDQEDNNRAIIAIDPTTPYNLKGLGLLLDAMEIRKLNSMGHKKEELINNCRAGFHRNDPWYDGRSALHNYTIIGAPINGSFLSDDNIIQAIRASELWMKASNLLNENFSIDFDLLVNFPEPKLYQDINIQDFKKFKDSNLLQKKSLLPKVYELTFLLSCVSPNNFFDSIEIKKIRFEILDEFILFYEALPKFGKMEYAKEITKTIYDDFPPNYLHKWLISISFLPWEQLYFSASKVLKSLPDQDRFLFFANIQNLNLDSINEIDKLKILKLSESHKLTILDDFFKIFEFPSLTHEEIENNPLYFFQDTYVNFEDILVAQSLGEKSNDINFLPIIPTGEKPLSLEEIDNFKTEVSEIIHNQIVRPRLGEDYRILREQRNQILSLFNDYEYSVIKRITITRISELSYYKLGEVINEILKDLDSQNNIVKSFKINLEFFLSIKRFEDLLDRYCVYLRLKSTIQSVENNSENNQLLINLKQIEIIHFVSKMWKASINLLQFEDKNKALEQVNSLLMQINNRQDLINSISFLDECYDQFYDFFTAMAEELQTTINTDRNNLDICFTLYHSLKPDGKLICTINKLPVFFKYVFSEIFFSYRKYYLNKIQFFQTEFYYVLESDNPSSDNEAYLEFCDKLLIKTVSHEWVETRSRIKISKDSILQKSFFEKYLIWTELKSGDHNKKTLEEKMLITQIASNFRTAQGKHKKGLAEIVNYLSSNKYNNYFNKNAQFLHKEKNFEIEPNKLPQYIYFEAYDFLTEEYINMFDIQSVSNSISSFSTKYPKYITWLTNKSKIRSISLILIALMLFMGLFDPNLYAFEGNFIRPPFTEFVNNLIGIQNFLIISDFLKSFWITFIICGFLAPIGFIFYKIVISAFNKISENKSETFSFIKVIERIEGKKSKLLYLGFISPLILIITQLASSDEILRIIVNFKGIRLVSMVIILIALILYSIYQDVADRNVLKPSVWVWDRTNHMFWLYYLQTLLITIFVIDFLFRFQLSVSSFSTPSELFSLGVSGVIILKHKYFDIVLMPLLTIVISFITLFFSVFINRVFNK
jgi:hypothetical protein